ncbi:TPA: hypothetical protein PPN70_002294 [Serratia rubidaea]|nr:hypothetical protein [Serratia rubidaea]HDJ1446981.1 hypothetical protein [Serratia rubidaea]HDJ1461380.1 hypothetical protein [Serratia rubidaea]HDJ2772562.1 hypothetical protein [Serratia rubidaea]
MDYSDIAERIVKVTASPETIRGLARGAMSVPIDLGYLTLSIFDTGNRWRMQTERIRLFSALRAGMLNHHQIMRATRIIIDVFASYIPNDMQDRVYRGMVSPVAGRALTTGIITATIANQMIAAGSAAFLSKTVAGSVGFVLTTGGLVEHCIYKSFELERKNMQVYYKLRQAGNLDFLYFLLKPYLEPFIDALSVRNRYGEGEFVKILEILEHRAQ